MPRPQQQATAPATPRLPRELEHRLNRDVACHPLDRRCCVGVAFGEWGSLTTPPMAKHCFNRSGVVVAVFAAGGARRRRNSDSKCTPIPGDARFESCSSTMIALGLHQRSPRDRPTVTRRAFVFRGATLLYAGREVHPLTPERVQ